MLSFTQDVHLVGRLARGGTTRRRGERLAVTMIRLLALTAACLAVLPVSSALAGRLFATGHDLDFHCSSGFQCGYVDTAVSYVRGGAPDPTKPVLILERRNRDFSVALTETFGMGAVPSVSMDPRSAEFATAPLDTSLYSAILIGSDITCGGCDLNEFTPRRTLTRSTPAAPTSPPSSTPAAGCSTARVHGTATATRPTTSTTGPRPCPSAAWPSHRRSR